MSPISEGHFVRHFRGVRGARDAAMLDIAQDHALYHLHQQGLFEQGLVFKGGTALRKFRAGNAGRFSTDLDFAAPDPDIALDVLNALDGISLHGFSFTIVNLGDDGRRADLRIETPFGSPNLAAKVELSRHALSLSPEILAPVRLPIHAQYDVILPALPVVRVDEAVAEKLARFRRVSLARDLYDLYWFGGNERLDPGLARRLWVLKVYRDVVNDGRGSKPLTVADVLTKRSVKQFERDDIGYLTQPVELEMWMAQVNARYAFLADLTDEERRWCECNPRDSREVSQALAAMSFR